MSHLTPNNNDGVCAPLSNGERKMNATTVIGLDIGDKYTHACVLDGRTAQVLERPRLRSTPAHVAQFFEEREPCRVVLEAGSHSNWMQRAISAHGHEVILANPRKIRMRGAEDKSDLIDAEYLARMGRADPTLLYPVTPRSERVHHALAVVRAREQLVEIRTSLVNHVRGVVKANGARMPSCSTRSFHNHAEAIDDTLQPALNPLMVTLEQVTKQIREHDAQVERLCREFPETACLYQVPGVGYLTALVYVLIIEDPTRFESSRKAGAFLGLVPRRSQSGDTDPALGIRHSGDRLLRRVMIQAAHYILGPFGPDSELKRHGERVLRRGGRSSKKKAAVAVARKLAVLLHALWRTGATYEPLKVTNDATKEATKLTT